MNRNQLERLNKVLKSVVEKSVVEKIDENPRIKELADKIESYKEQLETAEPDDIENINYWINFYNKEIEEEKLNKDVNIFKSYKYVKQQYINNLIKEYKQTNEDYKKTYNEWVKYYELNIEFDGVFNEKEQLYAEALNYFVEEFKTRAYLTVEDMEENKEFEQYYYIHSGKKAYDDKIEKINHLKEVQSKLNDVINDYAVKFAMLTIEDFKTYVSLWNEFINEPCEISFDSLYKVKYLGKLYEVYKYEVKDSVLYERVQCCTVDGVKKDLSNIYLKEIEIVNSTEVKPFDVITYKGATYEVYKINVVGSELYKRVKAKSTISNKTRDFKNYYLKKLWTI